MCSSDLAKITFINCLCILVRIGNILLDLHGIEILEPLKIEKEINNIPGVIEVGIFAINKPELVIVGKEDSYNLIES